MSNVNYTRIFCVTDPVEDSCLEQKIVDAVPVVTGVFGSVPFDFGFPVSNAIVLTPLAIIPINNTNFSGANGTYSVKGNITDDSTGASGGWIINEPGLYEVCVIYQIRSTTAGPIVAGPNILNATIRANIGAGFFSVAQTSNVLLAPTTIAGNDLEILTGCAYINASAGDVLRLHIQALGTSAILQEVLNRSLSIRLIN